MLSARQAVWFLAAASTIGLADLDVSFADSSYTNEFSEQWSYDQHETAGHNKHFDVGEHDGRKSLRVRVYEGDKGFTDSTPTAPRSELSLKEKHDITHGVDYVVKWDWQLQSYSSGYQFAFMQLFGGSGPNIFLRWEFDSYILWCGDCSNYRTDFSGSASEDVGKWIAWEVRFKLSTSSDGYIHVYRDNVKVAAVDEATSKGDDHYLKLGLYTQHEHQAKDAAVLLSNLHLTSSSPPSPPRRRRGSPTRRRSSPTKFCVDGYVSGSICCAGSCGTCGGSGCGHLPGGSSQCCTSNIEDADVTCEQPKDVACVIPGALVSV